MTIKALHVVETFQTFVEEHGRFAAFILLETLLKNLVLDAILESE